MNIFGTTKEIARGFSVPVEADSVDCPEIVYGPSITAIYFATDDEKYCRATFEGFDSMKVCRGEYCPYDDDWEEGSPYCWVSKVENSSWLIERHAYESSHYKDAYGFGGNVDEMLTDFSHYLFCFHDQFIEVIASGVWFEVSDEPFSGNELTEGHPFLPLPKKGMEYIEAHDLLCQVRLTPLDKSVLVENAKYSSQPIMEFAPELDGEASVSISLILKYRSNKLCSVLTKQFGGQLALFEGIASISDVKPYIETWLGEVRDRRREMGK